MRKIIVYLISAGLLIGFMEIGEAAGTKPKKELPDKNMPKMVTVSISDSNDVISLNPGDTLDVVLEAIPGTGFAWYVDQMDFAYLREIDLPANLTPKRPIRVGAPEEMHFYFESFAPGKTLLRLVYKRLWEKDVPPVSTFEIAIDIERANAGESTSGK